MVWLVANQSLFCSLVRLFFLSEGLVPVSLFKGVIYGYCARRSQGKLECVGKRVHNAH